MYHPIVALLVGLGEHINPFPFPGTLGSYDVANMSAKRTKINMVALVQDL